MESLQAIWKRGSVRVTVAVVAVAAIAAAVSACGGGGSDEDSVRSLVGREFDAIADRDWEAYFELQHPDVQAGCDPDDSAASWDSDFGAADPDEDYEITDVEVDGSTARVSIDFIYDGEDSNSDTFEYTKVDGRWYVDDYDACPDGSARTATSGDDGGDDGDNDGDGDGDSDDDIASLRQALTRISEDGSDADFDAALEMKDTMTRFLMRVRSDADQSSYFYLDDAWSTFVRMAESDSESLRFTAASVQADVVVGYIDDAEEALANAASDRTRTANASRTPAVNRTPTVRPSDIPVRVSTPTVRAAATSRAGTPVASRPDGPYGTAASATFTFDGQTSRFTGGRCTLDQNGRRMIIDLTNQSDEFYFRAVTTSTSVQQAIEAGTALVQIGIVRGAGGYIDTSGIVPVLDIADDLASGTFSGTFLDSETGQKVEITGSFTC